MTVAALEQHKRYKGPPLADTILLFWISWQILWFIAVITNFHTFPYILNSPPLPPKPGPPVEIAAKIAEKIASVNGPLEFIRQLADITIGVLLGLRQLQLMSNCSCLGNEGILLRRRRQRRNAPINAKVQHPPPGQPPGHLNFWRLAWSNARPPGLKRRSNAPPSQGQTIKKCETNNNLLS